MCASASGTDPPHDGLPDLNYIYSRKVIISRVAQWLVDIGNNVNSIYGLRRLFNYSGLCLVSGAALPLAPDVTL